MIYIYFLSVVIALGLFWRDLFVLEPKQDITVTDLGITALAIVPVVNTFLIIGFAVSCINWDAWFHWCNTKVVFKRSDD